MANTQDGLVLCEHITQVLNDIITKTGKQIDKDEPAIWDGFLHQLTNDEWESIFTAFKLLIEQHSIHLTHHQQRKFDEAYITFQKDKLKRDRCMDVRNRFMNTKTLAWGMIMTIREVVNQVNKTNIPNVDKPVVPESKPHQPGKRRKINITAKIEIWEDLFDIE
jgi:hypothetical protein